MMLNVLYVNPTAKMSGAEFSPPAVSGFAGRRSLQKKTVVVYNGLDFENIEKISPTDLDKEFGFRNAFPYPAAVGILNPAKGFHTAVRAGALLKPHFPEMIGLIIGDGFSEADRRYRESLTTLVDELDLGRNFVFTGFRSDALSLMKAADAVIHPAEYAEPFPRSLLEASGLGKPVVAGRLGAAARRSARAKLDIANHADKIVEVYRGVMGRAA